VKGKGENGRRQQRGNERAGKGDRGEEGKGAGKGREEIEDECYFQLF